MAEQVRYQWTKTILDSDPEKLCEADLEEVTTKIKNQIPHLVITRTCVVKNNFLEAMYNLKKEEYKVRYKSVTETILYHATSEYNANCIVKDNFDWRKVTRSKFGIGVSFSHDPDYADYHCNSNNGIYRAFIVTKVLIGTFCAGNSNMTIPSGSSDTAIGNGKVYVKFNDNEFLPLFVVFYNAPDRRLSYQYLRQQKHRNPWNLLW